MFMHSMTGFGSSSVSTKNFKLEVSVKSVNSRFLDIKFYTSSYYSSLESEISKMISQKCKRGYFIIHMDRYPQRPLAKVSLQWNEEQAKKWKQIYNKASKNLKLKQQLLVSDLIQRESVVSVIKTSQSLNPIEKKKTLSALSSALQACLQERKREGLALKKDILSNIQKLINLLQQIQQQNQKQQNQKLKQKTRRLKNTNHSKNTSEPDKSDIHEEIIRISEHLKRLKKWSATSGLLAIGRKLDFYTQEISRELNTIGSKAHLSSNTLKIVEGKCYLEKIKEQLQNVQ